MPREIIVTQDALAVLDSAKVDGQAVALTGGQLPRPLYVEVNKVLETIGGKWNTKARAHLFDSDPSDLLDAVLLTGRTTPRSKGGYFPTPRPLALHVVSMADIQPGMTVLEPSAGQGHIAEIVRELHPDSPLSVMEIQPANQAVLASKSFHFIGADFFGYIPEVELLFDRIVMNPPFELQADIRHVTHAFECLKPGGRLVSVMSSGVEFRKNRKTEDFRALVSQHGHMEANPPDAFKESGVNVKTVTVVLTR